MGKIEILDTTKKRFNSTSERRLYYIDHVPKVPPSSPTDLKATVFSSDINKCIEDDTKCPRLPSGATT